MKTPSKVQCNFNWIISNWIYCDIKLCSSSCLLSVCLSNSWFMFTSHTRLHPIISLLQFNKLIEKSNSWHATTKRLHVFRQDHVKNAIDSRHGVPIGTGYASYDATLHHCMWFEFEISCDVYLNTSFTRRYNSRRVLFVAIWNNPASSEWVGSKWSSSRWMA